MISCNFTQPGLNFINVLWAVYKGRSQNFQKFKKNTDDLSVFFVLLGSAHVKAAHIVFCLLPLKTRASKKANREKSILRFPTFKHNYEHPGSVYVKKIFS